MRLYKFFSGDEHHIDALEKYSVWFSKPEKFNDPFEGVYRTVIKKVDDLSEVLSLIKLFHEKKLFKGTGSDFDINNFLIQLYASKDIGEIFWSSIEGISSDAVKKIQKNFYDSGVACFLSKNEKKIDPLSNSLMWGHYGNGLRGFVTVLNDGGNAYNKLDFFEFKNISSLKVSYKDKPAVVDPLELMAHLFKNDKLYVENDIISVIHDFNGDESDPANMMLSMLHTKSNEWAYENETRFICEGGEGLRKYKNGVIKEIVVGEKMSSDMKSRIEKIANENNILSIKEAFVSPLDYKINIRNYRG